MHSAELSRHVAAARADGREVVAVLGLGFVGAAVAATLAAARHAGRPRFLVLGLERDTPEGRRKVAAVDAGRPPVQAGDPELERVVAAAAVEPRTLVGALDVTLLAAADVVVCCTSLDLDREPGQVEQLDCRVDEHAETLREIGRHVRPGTLVLVESTLPLGASEQVLAPALTAGLRDQGIDTDAHPARLAYAYERVTPGPDYLASVSRMPRSFAGLDEVSADLAQAFLEKYVDVERHPLTRHASLRAAELAKLMENAYRATNIAFIDEWADLAERAGIDLHAVIDSIRQRRGTHDNMMRPGLGVGGQCVTKDGLLARFGARELLGIDVELPYSSGAILTNERMPLRAVNWFADHTGGDLAGRRALLIGLTYLPGVADTRSSPAETAARALLEAGVRVEALDPLVPTWRELPEVPVRASADELEGPFDLVVVSLPDPAFEALLPRLLPRVLERGALVVDPWNRVGTELACALGAAGVRVRVYGRGDLQQPAAPVVEAEPSLPADEDGPPARRCASSALPAAREELLAESTSGEAPRAGRA